MTVVCAVADWTWIVPAATAAMVPEAAERTVPFRPGCPPATPWPACPDAGALAVPVSAATAAPLVVDEPQAATRPTINARPPVAAATVQDRRERPAT